MGEVDVKIRYGTADDRAKTLAEASYAVSFKRAMIERIERGYIPTLEPYFVRAPEQVFDWEWAVELEGSGSFVGAWCHATWRHAAPFDAIVKRFMQTLAKDRSFWQGGGIPRGAERHQRVGYVMHPESPAVLVIEANIYDFEIDAIRRAAQQAAVEIRSL